MADVTFSSQDVIRIFNKHLTREEQITVIDYFSKKFHFPDESPENILALLDKFLVELLPEPIKSLFSEFLSIILEIVVQEIPAPIPERRLL